MKLGHFMRKEKLVPDYVGNLGRALIDALNQPVIFNYKLLIAVPDSSSFFTSPRFWQNYDAFKGQQAMNLCLRAGITYYETFICESFPLDSARNEICNMALDKGFDYLLFIDADQLYPPNFISQLLAADVDVIGPIYNKKAPPFTTVCGHHLRAEEARRWWEGPTDPEQRKLFEKFQTERMEGKCDDWFLPLMEPEVNPGPVEVDVTGVGGLLIKRRVLEALEQPMFHYRYDKRGLSFGTEDVPFCKQVKAKGFKIYVDTSCVSAHLATVPVDVNNWYQNRHFSNEWVYFQFVKQLREFGKIILGENKDNELSLPPEIK